MISKDLTKINILFLSAEAHPFIKVGGLGDYAGSLPQAIKSQGDEFPFDIDLRVILPYHNDIHFPNKDIQKVCDISVPKKKGYAKGSIYELFHANIHYYFVKRKGNASGYQTVYNYSSLDDARKYIFFSLASIHFLKEIGWQPHIIHANDWHTATAVKILVSLRETDDFYRQMKSILVIHNLPYLGEGSQPILDNFSVQNSTLQTLPDWARSLPLPIGLDAADKIVAVSPTYAKELHLEEFGDGLAPFFIANQKKITGILNGIDTESWDPAVDNGISNNFSVENIGARRSNKDQVLSQLGFQHADDQPLLILISRLTYQKGIDLLLSGLPGLINRGWFAVILGKGQLEYERGFTVLEQEFPERIKYYSEYNERLARQLYAAGDILLMPSLYEPCGLSQMIAMRYGCVPLARSVGGLKDSINSDDNQMKDGYLFSNADVLSFTSCLNQVLDDFEDKKKWVAIQSRGMRKDFSWQSSAGKYINLYLGLINPNSEK